MKMEHWQFWIDVGGTFTDCFAIDPNGTHHQLKILSSGIIKGSADFLSLRSAILSSQVLAEGFWNSAKIRFIDLNGHCVASSTITAYDEDQNRIELNDEIQINPNSNVKFEIDVGLVAPVLGIHLLTKTPVKHSLPKCDVYLGTTKGTNALLTRSGSRTALVTSAGLSDFLLIGDQARPRLFDLDIKKPVPLFEKSISINERTLADGTVEIKPDSQRVRAQLEELKQQGIESIAVCLIHGFRYPEHEKLVKQIANQIGFDDIRLSSDVAPLIKLVSRGETTVLDAYLNPIISDYLDVIEESIDAESRLQLITSAGFLSQRSQFSGKDSVLSGPAGGVVGAAGVAKQLGLYKCIGFDMGGTSTDVARYDGKLELEFESQKAGVRIVSPMMSIETVAAGGGSICDFDGTRLIVGPQSAGADPGPACYGAGGPLTVTDINLYLGRIDSNQFPFPLDLSAVEFRLNELVDRISEQGFEYSPQDVAIGFLKIANHNMASAISTISVKRGFDPRKYVIVSFGGAGSQHCCGVADELDISKILVHPKSSILSAYGIRLADQSYSDAQSILERFSESTLALASSHAIQLFEKLRKKFDEGIELIFEKSIELRYEGTQTNIIVDLLAETSVASAQTQFQIQHERLYGYSQNRPLELVCVRARVTHPGQRIDPQKFPDVLSKRETEDKVQFYSVDSKCVGSSIAWSELNSGDSIDGPAIIADEFTSIIVDKNWTAVVCDEHQILLEKNDFHQVALITDDFAKPDPIELEIFYSSFQSIAEQMGQALRNTAISVNVKERLDYSCAVFSDRGELIVNAPHIPVHLGAMSDAVKSTIRSNDDILPGDVFVTNDPYQGGSHLPDVTVLTPYFATQTKPIFWLANRAHHAEIGGLAPGSMPAGATKLVEEGVLIQNFRLLRDGTSYFDELRNLLTGARYPSRNPDENVADITAQVAANQMGCDQFAELIGRHSAAKVVAYADHICSAAERKIRAALKKMPNFEKSFSDSMDDGTRICVSMAKSGDHLSIDFSGTDHVHSGNLNANRSIVASAVMYVLRCLINEDIPLNSGILRAVSIHLPEDCFLNPTPTNDRNDCPAVVGGNVETSQRVVDVLLGCLGVAAASQGTMNNWLVGDAKFGYYETVGGGSGATATGQGADAVHCHMSNTRLTDPEILETRYPMILREFAIRSNSGGSGHHCGGNGMIREVEFTANLTLSILASRRTCQPFGIDGGGPGQSGEAILIRDGIEQILESQCERKVSAGDRLRLMTPGGGGFGKAT